MELANKRMFIKYIGSISITIKEQEAHTGKYQIEVIKHGAQSNQTFITRDASPFMYNGQMCFLIDALDGDDSIIPVSSFYQSFCC